MMNALDLMSYCSSHIKNPNNTLDSQFCLAVYIDHEETWDYICKKFYEHLIAF